MAFPPLELRAARAAHGTSRRVVSVSNASDARTAGVRAARSDGGTMAFPREQMLELERTINDLEPGASVQVDKGLVFRLGPRAEYTYGDLKDAGGNRLLTSGNQNRAFNLLIEEEHKLQHPIPTVVVKVLQTKVGYRKYQFNHLLVATSADVDPSTLKGMIEAHTPFTATAVTETPFVMKTLVNPLRVGDKIVPRLLIVFAAADGRPQAPVDRRRRAAAAALTSNASPVAGSSSPLTDTTDIADSSSSASNSPPASTSPPITVAVAASERN